MSESTTLREFEAKRAGLASESLELCDGFNKFSDECSFLCDAFAAVARDPACITPETSEGIWYVCYKLKMQIRSYRDQIDEIHNGLRALKVNLNSEDD
ncbi:hypothetical protein SG34_027790 [Thalassomonas viridans]|uniref:Uncharacterized protein n=1 Tax=Thalassomonas viridans TaxID=137584 RepID=A0AAE9Z1W8_9GAMM|nr:hypothetical protein [Thalassomonas viridans]WDE05058.1 hypothetical protein SG34_027790 [Thalassomonas viridans]